MNSSKKYEQRDLFRGALEMMVLQSLRQRPMHGYALVQHIKQRSNELLQVEEGSLYPPLQRLLKEGQGEGGMGDFSVQPTGAHLSDYAGWHKTSRARSFEL
jgi:hypothetical protein